MSDRYEILRRHQLVDDQPIVGGESPISNLHSRLAAAALEMGELRMQEASDRFVGAISPGTEVPMAEPEPEEEFAKTTGAAMPPPEKEHPCGGRKTCQSLWLVTRTDVHSALQRSITRSSERAYSANSTP